MEKLVAVVAMALQLAGVVCWVATMQEGFLITGDWLPKTLACPRLQGHLHDLWREWTDGLFNNKPASQLSPTERGGKLKHIYFKRKHVWDIFKRFTDKGITHLVAIDKIEQAYGPGKSVTHYIKCIRNDKKTGGHPSLTVV
jgi:hypothetical protein